MIGAIINAAAIFVGGGIGLFCKKGISQRFSSAIMTAVALCVLAVGWLGLGAGENVLVLVLAMVLGAVLGTWIDLDKLLQRLGELIELRFAKGGTTGSFARAFVTASLFMGIGSMSIVGALDAGLTGNIDTLVAKSLIDFITAIMMAVSLGLGVLFSGLFVLVCEGGIALLAQVLAPLLTNVLVAEMSCAGSLLLVALGLNLLGLTKIKVANLLPAIVLAPFLSVLLTALNIG